VGRKSSNPRWDGCGKLDCRTINQDGGGPQDRRGRVGYPLEGKGGLKNLAKKSGSCCPTETKVLKKKKGSTERTCHNKIENGGEIHPGRSQNQRKRGKRGNGFSQICILTQRKTTRGCFFGSLTWGNTGGCAKKKPKKLHGAWVDPITCGPHGAGRVKKNQNSRLDKKRPRT